MMNSSARNPFPFQEDQTILTGFDFELVTPPTSFKTDYLFQCGACLCFPRVPVSIGCRHIMCESCAKLLDPKHCPFCRTRIQSCHRLSPRSDLFQDYIAHKVKCCMSRRRCGLEADGLFINQHQGSNDCPNKPIHFPYCKHNVAIQDIELHQRYHDWESNNPRRTEATSYPQMPPREQSMFRSTTNININFTLVPETPPHEQGQGINFV